MKAVPLALAVWASKMNYDIIGTIEDPVTVEQAKTHLRVISRSDDSYIADLVRAAREMAEAFMGRAVCLQKIRESANCWPCNGIFVPLVPRFRSLESFSYRDKDGETQTIDTDLFISIPSACAGSFG